MLLTLHSNCTVPAMFEIFGVREVAVSMSAFPLIIDHIPKEPVTGLALSVVNDPQKLLISALAIAAAGLLPILALTRTLAEVSPL